MVSLDTIIFFIFIHLKLNAHSQLKEGDNIAVVQQY